MQQCKDNENDAQFIPLEMKNNKKRIEMEQVLYAQVIMLRQKYLNFLPQIRKIEAKFKFRCQSAISQRWFDLDFEPDLY